ncbi:MAG: terminase family protein [Xenococcus sp. (in: cyanobacteria)]
MALTAQAIAHKQKVDRILRDRIKLLKMCESNLNLRHICKEKAARDVKWFVNYFVTTFNPRVTPSILPFILFPRQEECIDWILECYEKKQWGAVVKCRYTGLSWICCAVLTHKLIFENDFTGIIASNKAELVDKIGDPKTLFEKIIMIIKWLPSWMHDIDLTKHRKRMLITNPAKNSRIGGESGSDIGRGGRASMAVVDEFAHVEQDASAIAALSENTECALFISTPKGTGNKFYELADNPEISTFYYRWEADPRRTPEWRAKQSIKLGEEIAAQELDCDFNAAVKGVYIKAKWVKACVNAHLKIPELTTDEYISAGLDVAISGDKTILTYKSGSIITKIEELPPNEVTQSALLTNAKLSEDGVDSLCYDADGIGRDIGGTLENLDEPPDYEVVRFHGAGKPSDRYWEHLEKTSQEIYYNKRAEAWGILRFLIKNTYEHLNEIQKHDPSEMISIPDEPQLVIDLSKPTRKYRGSKELIESKQEMKARGLSSPDYGDSAAYAIYEEVSLSWYEDV